MYRLLSDWFKKITIRKVRPDVGNFYYWIQSIITIIIIIIIIIIIMIIIKMSKIMIMIKKW